MIRVIAFLFVLLGAAPAMAQCVGAAGVPFNCLQGNTPTVNDLVVGGSLTGAQANKTVKWTWGQFVTTINGVSCPLTGSCTIAGLAAMTSLTGDVTAAGPGASAATLATVFGSPGTVQGLTVNGKGLVTAAPGGSVALASGALTQAATNSATGTGTGLLAKQTATGVRTITTSDTSIGNLVGICVSGCGASGSALLGIGGNVSAQFDGSTTAGDYVVASITSAGKLHDAGASLPTGVNVVGFANTTNVGAGTYSMSINPVGIANATAAAVTPGGSTGYVQYRTSTPSFGGVAGFTFDGTSVVTLGVAGGAVGGLKFSNATSGFTEFVPVTGALGSSVLSVPARTATVATTTGTLTSGNATKFDASGNIVDGGGTPVTSASTVTNEKCQTFDSTTSVTAQTVDVPVEWTSYTITEMWSKVAGGGTYTASLKINGTNVTSCNGVTVSGTSNTVTTCTAANTGSKHDIVSFVSASPSGTVNQSYVCAIFTHTVN